MNMAYGSVVSEWRETPLEKCDLKRLMEFNPLLIFPLLTTLL